MEPHGAFRRRGVPHRTDPLHRAAYLESDLPGPSDPVGVTPREQSHDRTDPTVAPGHQFRPAHLRAIEHGNP